MYSVYLSTSQRENTKEIKHRWKKQEKANTKEKPIEQKESEKEDTRKQGEGGVLRPTSPTSPSWQDYLQSSESQAGGYLVILLLQSARATTSAKTKDCKATHCDEW